MITDVFYIPVSPMIDTVLVTVSDSVIHHIMSEGLLCINLLFKLWCLVFSLNWDLSLSNIVSNSRGNVNDRRILLQPNYSLFGFMCIFFIVRRHFEFFLFEISLVQYLQLN